MKLRCDLHLGDKPQKIFLVPRPEEKIDHLALKLAAYTMFHGKNPVVEPSPDHPSLFSFAHKPDLCVFDEGGDITHWIECGNVTLHKIDKVLRRLPSGRMIVVKSTRREAEKLRADLTGEVKGADRVEIWAWENGEFADWLKFLGEKTEIFGEAGERFINVVVNENPYVAQLAEI